MYELYDACTVMFFYRWVCIGLTGPLDWHSLHPRNKHIMIDLGTGNNNKMYVLKRTPHTHRLTDKTNLHSNWAMDNKQEVRSICVSFEFLPPWRAVIDDWHYRNGLSWGFEGPWSCRFAQRCVAVCALQYFILKTCLQITRLVIGISLLLIVDLGGTGSITELSAYLPPDPHSLRNCTYTLMFIWRIWWYFVASYAKGT